MGKEGRGGEGDGGDGTVNLLYLGKSTMRTPSQYMEKKICCPNAMDRIPICDAVIFLRLTLSISHINPGPALMGPCSVDWLKGILLVQWLVTQGSELY